METRKEKKEQETLEPEALASGALKFCTSVVRL